MKSPTALSIRDAATPGKRVVLRPPSTRLVGIWIGAAAALSLVLAIAAGVAHPHLPDLALAAAQPLAIKLHVTAAVGAVAIGTVLLLARKGRALHRALGWTWVGLMATVALSSFFIRVVNPGSFSWIHLISGWVVVALPMGVMFARRKEVARHRARMTALFTYGLLLAGVLTFLPGRLMWRLFLG